MSIFEIVKAEVTVKEVARHYGMRLGRNDMVCCPFHNDRHPSMKLNDRYYYCFGCGSRTEGPGSTGIVYEWKSETEGKAY